MSERISGSFPGGPGKRDRLPARSTPPRLERVESLENRLAIRADRMRGAARRRRLLVGLSVALAVAGLVGYLLGLQSHTTAADIMADQQAAQSVDRSELSTEVNRTLLELWRMEDVEAARNSGRSR